ncbi:MAG: M48 family metallopeptidase [Tannerellaceae bacterium]|nr:M48 family metallopeptidase [Tannerellaceae bacterium]
MTKFSIQFSLLILAFLCIWYSLSQIKWVEIFQIEKNASKLERELGDYYMNSLKLYGEVIEEGEMIDTLEEIKERICSGNNINPEKIKLHIVKTSEVNAFAAPDNNLVIFTGLIDYCRSYEELAGVMAHEIAHMEKNHIMKKLGKEIGLSTLLPIASSGTISIEAIRFLTSSAYDRSMEKEADSFAVKYLINSDINPAPMADMMYRLSLEESTLIKNLTLISTHPNSEDRAESILKQAEKETQEYNPLCLDIEWEKFQAMAKE